MTKPVKFVVESKFSKGILTRFKLIDVKIDVDYDSQESVITVMRHVEKIIDEKYVLNDFNPS